MVGELRMNFIERFLRARQEPKHMRGVRFVDGSSMSDLLRSGYSTLADCPEVVAGCFKIAQLIGSMTIYLTGLLMCIKLCTLHAYEK